MEGVIREDESSNDQKTCKTRVKVSDCCSGNDRSTCDIDIINSLALNISVTTVFSSKASDKVLDGVMKEIQTASAR